MPNMLNKIISEIKETEKNYRDDLQLVVDLFINKGLLRFLQVILKPLTKDDELKKEYVDLYKFYLEIKRIKKIILISNNLIDALEKLEKQISNKALDKDQEVDINAHILGIVEIFNSFAKTLEKPYYAYSGIYSDLLNFLNNGLSSDLIAIEQHIKNFSMKSGFKDNGLNLQDYLIKPIQRVLKYPLFLREIRTFTEINFALTVFAGWIQTEEERFKRFFNKSYFDESSSSEKRVFDLILIDDNNKQIPITNIEQAKALIKSNKNQLKIVINDKKAFWEEIKTRSPHNKLFTEINPKIESAITLMAETGNNININQRYYEEYDRDHKAKLASENINALKKSPSQGVKFVHRTKKAITDKMLSGIDKVDLLKKLNSSKSFSKANLEHLKIANISRLDFFRKSSELTIEYLEDQFQVLISDDGFFVKIDIDDIDKYPEEKLCELYKIANGIGLCVISALNDPSVNCQRMYDIVNPAENLRSSIPAQVSQNPGVVVDSKEKFARNDVKRDLDGLYGNKKLEEMKADVTAALAEAEGSSSRCSCTASTCLTSGANPSNNNGSENMINDSVFLKHRK